MSNQNKLFSSKMGPLTVRLAALGRLLVEPFTFLILFCLTDPYVALKGLLWEWWRTLRMVWTRFDFLFTVLIRGSSFVAEMEIYTEQENQIRELSYKRWEEFAEKLREQHPEARVEIHECE